MPKVAKRARVTDRAFYALFEDKAACFIATCERHGDQLRDLLEASVQQIEAAEDPMAAFDAGQMYETGQAGGAHDGVAEIEDQRAYQGI